jgi:hypothetical protein
MTQEVAMFGNSTKRKKAEKTAQDAWDTLVSTMGSAGGSAKSTAAVVGKRTSDTARSVGSRASDKASDLAETAQDKLSDVAEEAWLRASNAIDALSGRKPRKPWGWIAVGVLGGIAVGYAVAATAPKYLAAAMDKFNDEPQDDFVTGGPVPGPGSFGTTSRYDGSSASSDTGTSTVTGSTAPLPPTV